jgi:hypothetical protein
MNNDLSYFILEKRILEIVNASVKEKQKELDASVLFVSASSATNQFSENITMLFSQYFSWSELVSQMVMNYLMSNGKNGAIDTSISIFVEENMGNGVYTKSFLANNIFACYQSHKPGSEGRGLIDKLVLDIVSVTSMSDAFYLAGFKHLGSIFLDIEYERCGEWSASRLESYGARLETVRDDIDYPWGTIVSLEQIDELVYNKEYAENVAFAMLQTDRKIDYKSDVFPLRYTQHHFEFLAAEALSLFIDGAEPVSMTTLSLNTFDIKFSLGVTFIDNMPKRKMKHKLPDEFSAMLNNQIGKLSGGIIEYDDETLRDVLQKVVKFFDLNPVDKRNFSKF